MILILKEKEEKEKMSGEGANQGQEGRRGFINAALIAFFCAVQKVLLA